MNVWIIYDKDHYVRVPNELIAEFKKYGHDAQQDAPLLQWCDVVCILAGGKGIGDMANGTFTSHVADMYLTMPPNKPIVIVPTMHRNSWAHKAVQRNIETLKRDGCAIVDIGYEKGQYGCLANSFEIVAACDTSKFMFNYIPLPPHPGAFGVKRRHHCHTGVDLYVHRSNAMVYPFEDGEVIACDYFTGAPCGSPWWNTTSYVAIKHGDKVIVYGEICPISDSTENFIGREVTTKDPIGIVIPVTKNRHPEFEYHNTKMLHVELYNADGFKSASVHEWEIDKKQPDMLLDPTEYLMEFKARSGL